MATNTLSTAEVLVKWRQAGLEQVQAGTKGFSASLDAMGKKATAAGKAMSVAITAPIALMGKNMVNAASDLNESMSAVDQVFGKSAQTIQQFSSSAARDLGISRQASLQAAAQFGALFKGLGLGEQQMASFSTDVQQAAADLGSFHNVDPTEMLDKLRAGLTGESEPLKRFGILLTEDAVKLKAMELGLQDASGAIDEQDKLLARHALIMEGVGAATGDFARTSGGLANAQRILKASATDLAATFGQVLLPSVLRGVDIAQRFVDKLMALPAPMQETIVKIGVIAAAVGPALLILGQLAGALANLGPVLAALTGPFGLVIAGVAALGLAWQKNFLGIRDHTQAVLDKVGPAMERMVGFFTRAKERGLDPFTLAMRTLQQGADTFGAPALLDFLKEAERAGRRFGDALASGDLGVFVGELDRQAVRLGTWFDEQVRKARQFAVDFVREFVPAGGARGTLLALLGIDEDQDISNDLNALFGDIRTAVTGARDRFIKELISAGAGRSNAGNVVLGLLGVDAGSMEDNVNGMFADLRGAVERAVGPFMEDVRRRFEETNWTAVGQTLQDKAGDMATLFLDFNKWRLEKLSEFGAFLIEKFRQVDWDAVGTALQQGAQKGIEKLGEFASWVWAKLETVDWDSINRGLWEKSWQVVDGVKEGIIRGLEALADFNTWFMDRMEPHWGTLGQWLLGKGQELIQGLIEGVQQKSQELMAWFNDMSRSILEWIGNAGEALFQKGQEFIQGLRDGAEAKFKELVQWITGVPGALVNALPGIEELAGYLFDHGASWMGGFKDGVLAKVKEIEEFLAGWKPSWPSLGSPPEPSEPMTGGKGQNTPAGWGGNVTPSGSAFRRTWVGEYGPEMVLLPPGAMVVPHGASQAKDRASRMALGGVATRGAVPGWREWLASQPGKVRRALRSIRANEGRLGETPELARQAMMGLMNGSLWVNEYGNIQGIYQPGPGGGRAEDGSAVPADFWGGSQRTTGARGRRRGRRAEDGSLVAPTYWNQGQMSKGGVVHAQGGAAKDLTKDWDKWFKKQDSYIQLWLRAQQGGGLLTRAVKKSLLSGQTAIYMEPDNTAGIFPLGQGPTDVPRSTPGPAKYRDTSGPLPKPPTDIDSKIAARWAEEARRAEEQRLRLIEQQRRQAERARQAEEAKRAADQAARDAALANSAETRRQEQRRVEEAARRSRSDNMRRGRPAGRPGLTRDPETGEIYDPNLTGSRPRDLLTLGNPLAVAPAQDRAAEARRLANFLGDGPNELRREMKHWNEQVSAEATRKAPRLNPDLVPGTPEFTKQRDRALRHFWNHVKKGGELTNELRLAFRRGHVDLDAVDGTVARVMTMAEDGSMVPVSFYDRGKRKRGQHRRAALGNVVTVGEYGPEAVVLPTGSMVVPHGAHAARLRTQDADISSGGPNFYAPVTFVMQSADIEREVRRQLDQRIYGG